MLEAAFVRAAGGCAGTVLVAGDAGIGKSRLVDELSAAVQDRARVLVGGCIELGEGTLPYAPVVEALRPLSLELASEDMENLFGAGRSVLAPLLSNGGFTAGDGRRRGGPQAQARLFEALLALLVSLGTRAPVLVVLEDLHWADASTRDLLVFLARNLRRGRVLLVGTYRTDELHRRHPFRRPLAEMERSGHIQRLELRAFDRAELAQQLTGIIGEGVAADTIDTVLARSEGNPFFTEELVASGDVTGDLSPTLLDVVLARVEALPTLAQQVLRVAAVVGHRAEHALLAEASGMAEEQLEEGLRAAVDQQVMLSDAKAGSYAFRHALTQEAVYSDILAGERRRLHTRVAELLACRLPLAGAAGARQAAEVAHHWFTAGDQPRALAEALRAGHLAEGVNAPAEARAQYERALDLWEKVQDPEAAAGCDHATLLERAGYCAYLAGAPDRAIALQHAAIERVDPVTDPHRTALLYEKLGGSYFAAADMNAASAAWRQARTLLASEPPSSDHARVMAVESRSLMLSFHHLQAEQLARQALAMARHVGDRILEGCALNNLGSSLGWLGRVDEGLACLERARTIAVEVGRPEDLARAYVNLCVILDCVAARSEEAVGIAREGIEVARRLGLRDVFGVLVAAYGAEALLRLGRWDEAEKMAGLELLDQAAPLSAIQLSLVSVTLEIRRGRLDEARQLLDRLAPVSQEAYEPARARFHIRQAELAVWERRHDAALLAVSAGLAVVAESDDAQYGPEMCAVGARAAVEGRRPQAHVIGFVEEARRLSRRPPQHRSVLPPEPSVFALVAEAEYTRLGHPDPDRWADVANRWRQLPRPFHLAYAKWREGEALLAVQGDRERATQALIEARRTAVDLGAALLADEIMRLATRARLNLEPTVVPSVDVVKSVGAELGLTPREGEVLALLGQGRTNRQIAQELFISDKTASVHVSNILRKLNVSNRFQAAEMGDRLGLTSSPLVPRTQP